ncbi:RNA polymerase sigma factor [Butyricimonas virosa]|jgi:RNA polymerase sigma factor, sigma-70 family|uniref:RNA polymerase subunit sigma-24 n=1 Tax=Butyricimonas virosa TaxID=544645 RepID=A0A415QJB6_9BACT|nr:sigma-70 family RNA polymerase sigma factor [Butyricimonas virosa]MDY5534877.1 sigma-70 family RNA polymerase sigma factor [Butyricimonas virosa]RHM43640.1 RNA polymerase subunit sigma-24 [Butyricimonas virosa]HAH72062.1 RNA polymerase subunit sigma-24 [Butyricimonas virosa]
MSVSDAQIIALLQAGKRQGMNALFDRYYKPLVVFADDLLHDLPEAEDTVLEQFVKLWEKELYEHIHPNALSTFLFTIVKNACMNQIAKKGLPTEQLDLPHYAIAQEESYLLDETIIETILAAVRKLPEKTQQVVQSVMCQGLSYQETADELEVSINTVKTLLKAGMRELRSELEEYKKMFLFFMLYPQNFQ